jgi:hypothetical protein
LVAEKRKGYEYSFVEIVPIEDDGDDDDNN